MILLLYINKFNECDTLLFLKFSGRSHILIIPRSNLTVDIGPNPKF